MQKVWYEKQSEFMAEHARMAIVRKFQVLNMRNILFWQVQLTNLERQLYDAIGEDIELGDNLSRSVTLMEKAGEGGILWPIHEKIRRALKEFSQYGPVNALEGATNATTMRIYVFR
jgi:hypothetical protein